MAEIPDFIFKILDKEIYENHCDLLRRVAAKYSLDGDALIAEFLKNPVLHVVPPSDKKIIVTQKHNVVPGKSERCRCIAHTKNGSQCTKDARLGDANQLCGGHARMLEEKGDLDFGTRARCCARVWNRGNGGQCSRLSVCHSDLCGPHNAELEKNGVLHHGRIQDPPPAAVFKCTTRKKALYK